MIPILVDIVQIILNLVIVVLIVQAVLSWLIAFDIASRRTPIVDTLWRFTTALTDPMLRPLRRIIPPVAGVDLSPMVLILIIYAVSRLLPVLLLGQAW
jgi:YggT family protein